MSYSAAKQVLITLASCVWFPELNVRRAFDTANKVFTKEPAVFNSEDPDTKALIESFRDRGYDPQYPCVVGPITKDQVKDAVARRNAEWLGLQNALKLNGSPENAAKLAAFEFFYLTDKKKIIEPEYLGCTGNRRSACIFEAGVQRLLLTLKGGNERFPKDIEVNKHPEKVLKGLEIYAVSESFADDDARHIRQIAENTAKTEGFKELAPVECLLQLRDGVETGRIKQTQLRDMFKAGTGQKMYGVLILNSRFPKLRVLERIMLPVANKDSIPWPKLPQGGSGESGAKVGFPTVLCRTNRVELDAYNNKMQKENPEKVRTFMTETDVEAQIQAWKLGEGNADKIMEKPLMKTIQSASSVKVVRDLFEDVLLNKKVAIDRLTAVAPTFNALDNLIGTACFNGVNTLLQLVDSTPDAERLVLVERLIAAAQAPVPAPKAATKSGK